MKQIYIGHAQYFATGEGRTDIFASGSIEEIVNFADPFYAKELTFFSLEKIQGAFKLLADNDEFIYDTGREDYPALYCAFNLQFHLPVVAKMIKDGTGHMVFGFKLHLNFS